MKAMVKVWLCEHEGDRFKIILCAGLKNKIKTYTLTKFVSKQKKKIGYEINHSSSFCCDDGMGVFCSPSEYSSVS